MHAAPASLTPSPIETPSALSLLASQPSHYISALLLGRRYLLTPRDILTVPKMKGVKPGDKIQLTRILEVGSRDYTLRATPMTKALAQDGLVVEQGEELVPALATSSIVQGIPRDWQRHPDSLPYLAEEIVQGSLVVLEHTKGQMFEVTKFKKRKGYRRLLRSKLGFTKLRVGEIVLGTGQA